MMEITFFDNKVKVTGEINIYNANQFINDILSHSFVHEFDIDLSELEYIDSSGISALIHLYNHYNDLNIPLYVSINPSNMVGEIFSLGRLDILFSKEKQSLFPDEGNINYQESFAADTKILAYVIDKLFRDLEKANYNAEEAQEIVVSVDEAITNAILETIKVTGEVLDHFDVSFNATTVKTVAVKWEIRPDEFFATIIDHGKGLDLKSIQSSIPNVTDKNYFAEVEKYQAKGQLQVRANGKEITLKRLGVGLKLMTSFMDAIIIDFVNTNEARSSHTAPIKGTILTLYRKRKSA